jgi:hypothetical protein
MNERKPTAGFWIAAALVVMLVGYPLSFGPVCWIVSRIDSCSSTVLCLYRPLDWLALESPSSVGKLLASFGQLWMSDNLTLRIGERSTERIHVPPGPYMQPRIVPILP